MSSPRRPDSLDPLEIDLLYQRLTEIAVFFMDSTIYGAIRRIEMNQHQIEITLSRRHPLRKKNEEVIRKQYPEALIRYVDDHNMIPKKGCCYTQ
jgi:hypothetical protein